MAKAKIQGLDEAIDEIFKDYKKVIKDAATEATKQAKDDLYANAVSCLASYYNDYRPETYERTYSLINSFVPYAKDVRETQDGYECVAGVEFDPNKIQGMYRGSEIYTPTDAEWIIDNFLSGIHPRTDGSTIPGGGNYENKKYYGSFVPSFEMQKYIDRYYYEFDYNFRRNVSREVLRMVKKVR